MPRAIRDVLIVSAVLLLVLAALAANEIFPNTPFLTPETGAELAGTWHQGAIILEISTNGRVTGQIGTVRIVHASLARNRTRLGERLNLRTAYVIRGTLEDGRQFSSPVNVREDRLEGSLFTADPGESLKGNGPRHIRLTRTPGPPSRSG